MGAYNIRVLAIACLLLNLAVHAAGGNTDTTTESVATADAYNQKADATPKCYGPCALDQFDKSYLFSDVRPNL